MKTIEVNLKITLEVDGVIEKDEINDGIWGILNTMSGAVFSENIFDHKNFALLWNNTEILDVKEKE